MILVKCKPKAVMMHVIPGRRARAPGVKLAERALQMEAGAK